MEDFNRLSQIETLWSVIRQAHNEDESAARDAQRKLLEQYGSAIQRYLNSKLPEAVADDIYQDFAIKFVRGDLQNASPDKGRFRTYIRSILFRQVADHFRKIKRQGQHLDIQFVEPEDNSSDAPLEEEFAEVWRDEILKKAWGLLEQLEIQSDKPWFSLLQMRVTNPALRSMQLAQWLSEKTGKPISSSNVRVLLHRAREKFAYFLIESISASLNSNSPNEIEDELVELRLLEYCQAALSEYRKTRKQD